jgi:hypothetical protein
MNLMSFEELLFEKAQFDKGVFAKIAQLASTEPSLWPARELAEKHGFKFVKEGAYKAVFSVGEDKVLKVAKDRQGNTGILAEINSFKCSPKFFPEVFASDKKGLWSVVEKVAVLETKEAINKAWEYFEFDWSEYNQKIGKIVGWAVTRTEEPLYWLAYLVKDALRWKQFRLKKNIKEEFPEELEAYRWLFSHRKFVEFIQGLARCDVDHFDLKADNFGFRVNGQLVVIDSDDEGVLPGEATGDEFYNVGI